MLIKLNVDRWVGGVHYEKGNSRPFHVDASGLFGSDPAEHRMTKTMEGATNARLGAARLRHVLARMMHASLRYNRIMYVCGKLARIPYRHDRE